MLSLANSMTWMTQGRRQSRHSRIYGRTGYVYPVPEGNATNTYFTRTSNTQSLAGANRAVIQTMDFLTA